MKLSDLVSDGTPLTIFRNYPNKKKLFKYFPLSLLLSFTSEFSQLKQESRPE